jgi:hypothetical protein
MYVVSAAPPFDGVRVSVTREITSDSPPGAVDDSPHAANDTSTTDPSANTRRDDSFDILHSIR